MSPKTPRVYTFDALKLVAIAIIVLHHYQQVTMTHFPSGINWYDGNFYWGYLVELFFIISGYFAYNSLSKIKDGQSFSLYFSHKYLRFLPMLAICGAACIATESFYSRIIDSSFSFTFTLWNVVSSLSGFSRWLDSSLMINNPMWYISVLLLCLVVFYIVTKIGVRTHSSLPLIYGSMMALGLVMRAICTTYGLSLPFFSEAIARGLICFFLGILLALLFHDKRASHLFSKSTSLLFAALAIVVLFVLLYIFKPHYITSISKDALYYTLCFIVYPSFMVICNNESIQKSLSSDKLIFLSGTAYNMYTWHIPILFIFMSVYIALGLDLSSHSAMYGFLAICFMWGFLSNKLIDTPIAKMLNTRLKASTS